MPIISRAVTRVDRFGLDGSWICGQVPASRETRRIIVSVEELLPGAPRVKITGPTKPVEPLRYLESDKMIELPESVRDGCRLIFDAIPFEQSMPNLQGAHPKESALVDKILANPALQGRTELASGLWLYVDDLVRSHTAAQQIDDSTGAWWHGIMHRREGDFANSHYWMRRAEGHPLLAARPELDPHRFVDIVASATGDDPDIVNRQRQEWKALFEWSAARL